MLGLPVPGPHLQNNPLASGLSSKEATAYLRPLTFKSIKHLVPPCPGHEAMPDLSGRPGRCRGIYFLIEHILLESSMQTVGLR